MNGPQGIARPGLEWLEDRTTISEALLGLIWPALWTAAPEGAPHSEAAPIQSAIRRAELRGELPAAPLTLLKGTLPAQDARPEVVSLFQSDGFGAREFSGDPFADMLWGTEPFVAPARKGLPQATAAPVPPAVSMSPASIWNPGNGSLGQAVVPETITGGSGTPAGLLLIVAGSIDLHSGQGDPPRIQDSHFQASWQSGQYDDAGNFMSATEIMHLVAHKEKLYAATSVWNNVPFGDPQTGAQILRLDEPEGAWQVDHHFDGLTEGGQLRHIRATALQSVTFYVDGYGQELAEPVNMLVASVTDRNGAVLVYSRDDDTGLWTEMFLGQSEDETGQVRSFGMHWDYVTGVDHIFAGGSPLGVFSGVYDPEVPGRIRWGETAELAYENRFMSFTQANGYLYTAAKPYLFRRDDGPEASWRVVLQYPDPPPAGEGLRAMSAIPPLGGGENEVLLSTYDSGGGFVVRILPYLGHVYLFELDVREYLRERWGGLSREILTVGYNDMLKVWDPHTQQEVFLIGLLTFPPADLPRTSSWYLIRYPDTTYDLREIPALPHPFVADPVLLGTRSIVLSPFPQDEGQYLYFAGYDCVFLPARHTGWIYRTSVEAALAPP